MRKTMLLLAVIGLAGSLWAADPQVGTWKLNVAKSKFAPSTQAPVKEETRLVREQGDQYEITFTGTRTDGSAISDKWTYAQQGGFLKNERSALPQGRIVVVTVINPSDRYLTGIQDGKQNGVSHYVISKDGKTLTVTTKGTDANGKPFESLTVFDKQ
jgi:hypothetical protein